MTHVSQNTLIVDGIFFIKVHSGKEIDDIEFLENYDSSDDAQENIVNDIIEDFQADYSQAVPLSDSNDRETCIHLEIEITDEISREFLDDLSSEMVYDVFATRRSRSIEDGLDKTSTFKSKGLLNIALNASLYYRVSRWMDCLQVQEK